jgi:DnaJ-class molecular chaperone
MNPMEGFENLFSQMTGNPNVRVFHNGVPVNLNRQMQKPPPIIKSIEISLEQAYTGCTIPVIIERWILENQNTHHSNVTKKMESETVYISVPKGIDDNELIILRDRGNIAHDTLCGDLKIFVKVINKSSFIRKGLDLLYMKTITLKESLCGFEFDMLFINGKSFKIANNPGNIINTTFKKMIPKLGMEREGKFGNLIIEFKIIYPEKLTLEQVKKIKDIL